jgi:hypothetical protein
MFRALAGQ